MKKWWFSSISTLAFTLGAWAFTQTGMPAFDDLYGDLAGNGPISRRLGFTEDQRKDLLTYIEKKAESLRPIRDELAAAERTPGGDKQAAGNALYAARQDAFHGLKELMTAKQYDELKAWREEGKDEAPPETITQIGLPALNDLRQDLMANGPISRRMDLSEKQRRELLTYIQTQAGTMLAVKGDAVAAERKVERKEKKGVNPKEARIEQKDAVNDLVDTRENALRGLKALMTDKQVDVLTKWLDERRGK